MRIAVLFLSSLILLCAACDSDTTTPADSALVGDSAPADLGPDSASLKDGPAADQAVSPDGATPDSTNAPDQLAVDLPAADTKQPPDQVILPDAAMADSAAPPDAAQAVKDQTVLPDASAMDPSLHTSVISKFYLPTNATLTTQFGFDLTGDGKVNNIFGTLLSLMTTISSALNMQPYADQLVNSATILAMLELYGTSLTNDPGVWIQTHLGKDLDSNPLDNFTGSEQLGLHSASPVKSIVTGSISGGNLSASTGTLAFPVPLLAGTAPVLVNLKKLHAKAKVSISSLNSGVVGGAIDLVELHTKVLPAMAGIVTQVYQAASTPSAVKGLLKSQFDLNNDGKITSAEIQANLMIKLLLIPDVDTNGDKVADAVSFGIGFTSVKCSIKKTP